ncbi:uncharacterized protein E0L32_004813 [Thyridium curvatum]|uniref:N-acetyltransferase domain-containing protein n=1 Tax=Thyridium curvatum TaxID=1093900 RepID=A0A507B585_9PEZI|nr:uncharacterized protein E0L32_004813 [Thyridium curvatum]TPX14983.1 hypothetical protein E0L32_004813 [Thyridium curvatum]
MSAGSHRSDEKSPAGSHTGFAECAIDDSDADPEYAMAQQEMNQQKWESKDEKQAIQKVLPFTFAPNIRPLTMDDFESAVALEHAAFPPEHRASREKIEYRLTACPELSMGLFCTAPPETAKEAGLETAEAAKPVETDRADGAVSVLLAHIISTASNNKVVTDDDMLYPKDWKTSGLTGHKVGHQQDGRMVAIHSLAVSPKVQGCGLGKLIMKAYLQQMQQSGVADSVAILCQDYLVDYYSRFGFQNLGESKATFGGGGWTDMNIQLDQKSST